MMVQYRRAVSILFALLVTTVYSSGPACPKSLKREGCLTTDDMNSILSRWPQLFDVKYSGNKLVELASCTLAKDIKTYDKTFTFGQGGSGIQSDGRKQFIAQQQQAYDTRNYSATAPGGVFSKVFSFHSCNHIAFRFKFDGKTSGKTKCTSTTNTQRGQPILYFGTDLLKIKPGTILIEEAVTSADWDNNFLAIGADFNGSSLCPGTTPPPCDPDCGPCSAAKFVPRHVKLV